MSASHLTLNFSTQGMLMAHPDTPNGTVGSEENEAELLEVKLQPPGPAGWAVRKLREPWHWGKPLKRGNYSLSASLETCSIFCIQPENELLP